MALRTHRCSTATWGEWQSRPTAPQLTRSGGLGLGGESMAHRMSHMLSLSISPWLLCGIGRRCRTCSWVVGQADPESERWAFALHSRAPAVHSEELFRTRLHRGGRSQLCGAPASLPHLAMHTMFRGRCGLGGHAREGRFRGKRLSKRTHPERVIDTHCGLEPLTF